MDMFGWLWVLWLLAFCVLEGKALLDRRPDQTLSDHVWLWFSIRGQGPWWKMRRLFLALFMAWLTLHFLTGRSFGLW